MELGFYTLADMQPCSSSEAGITHQRVKHLIEKIELSDQFGPEVSGVEGHCRVEYVLSSPAKILADAALRTTIIKLNNAVTNLNSDDQQFEYSRSLWCESVIGRPLEVIIEIFI